MSDFGLTKDIFATSALIQDQLNQFVKETGDHPRKMSFPKGLFDRLCAESADQMMRKDRSILEMIYSFKIAGPNGYVIIERMEPLKP